VGVAYPTEICLCVTTPNSVIVGQTIRAYGDLSENFDPSRPAFQGHSRSLVPTAIDRFIYDFLLVFCSKYSPILYRFRDKWRYLRNCPTPLYLTVLLRGFPWNFVMAMGLDKSMIVPLLECQKYDDMSIRFDTVPALDRQTDKRTDRQTERQNW